MEKKVIPDQVIAYGVIFNLVSWFNLFTVCRVNSFSGLIKTTNVHELHYDKFNGFVNAELL